MPASWDNATNICKASTHIHDNTTYSVRVQEFVFTQVSIFQAMVHVLPLVVEVCPYGPSEKKTTHTIAENLRVWK